MANINNFVAIQELFKKFPVNHKHTRNLKVNKTPLKGYKTIET